MKISARTVLAALLLLVLATCAVEHLTLGETTGKVDFISFWLPARCFLEGTDPYVCYRSPLAASVSQSLSVLLYMDNPPFNPPLLFPLLAPFSLLPFERASALWLVFSLVVCVWAILFCERGGSIGERSAEKTLRVLVYLSFFPVLIELYFGQISPLLLAGFILYRYYLQRTGSVTFVMGLVLSVTLVKPHILYLLYVDLCLRSIREREWRAIAGFVTGAAILTVLALIIQPQMLSFYAELLKRAPNHMFNPTLGSWLQQLSGNFSIWLRCLPAITTSALLAVRYYFADTSKLRNADYLTALIPLTIITAPYGWVTDQILLIPVIASLLRRAGAFRGAVSAALVGCHLFAVFGQQSVGMHYYIWYPVFVGMIFYFFYCRDRGRPSRTSA